MRPKTNSGFALIDALVAIGLISVTATILGVIYPAVKISNVSQSNLIASAIALSKIDELKSTPFADLAVEASVGFADDNLSKLRSGTGSFTVVLFDADGDATEDEDIKKITVTVSWSEGGENKTVTYSTLTSETGLSP